MHNGCLLSKSRFLHHSFPANEKPTPCPRCSQAQWHVPGPTEAPPGKAVDVYPNSGWNNDDLEKLMMVNNGSR